MDELTRKELKSHFLWLNKRLIELEMSQKDIDVFWTSLIKECRNDSILYHAADGKTLLEISEITGYSQPTLSYVTSEYWQVVMRRKDDKKLREIEI